MVGRERVLTEHPQIAGLDIDGYSRDNLGREKHAYHLVWIRETHLDKILSAREPQRSAGVVERDVLRALRGARQRHGSDRRSSGIKLLQRRLGEHPDAAVLTDRKILCCNRQAGSERAI